MNSPDAFDARHGIRRQPQCPRCGTTPPEIVLGKNGPECADCGSKWGAMRQLHAANAALSPQDTQP